jgi:CreA protein
VLNSALQHAEQHLQLRRKERVMLKFLLVIFCFLAPFPAYADDEDMCVTTVWKAIGANHKVCVYSFTDPKIPQVTCYVSQARTGGVSGAVGLAEDPSNFSLSCTGVGTVSIPKKLPDKEKVFEEGTSFFFKSTNVTRFFDRKRNVLVYLAVSRRIIEGSPVNSVSVVPVQN